MRKSLASLAVMLGCVAGAPDVPPSVPIVPAGDPVPQEPDQAVAEAEAEAPIAFPYVEVAMVPPAEPVADPEPDSEPDPGPATPIVIAEGDSVIPQTMLHLSVHPLIVAKLAPKAWKWTAKQPHLSQSVFLPGPGYASPTFTANVAGEYAFSVEVEGPDGVVTTLPSQLVMVLPGDAIHVELLWHTPLDEDETDEGPETGSDMDLHFIHDAYAPSGPDLDKDGQPDGWFDQPFDCFWFNAHPNWGSFDPSKDDNPNLDRDDTDGAGPENLNMAIPENTVYRIGVHYWSDHEYGPSEATVRIYIYGFLKFEETCVLVNHDLWNVATISWPSTKVTPTADEVCSTITPTYQNPFFFQP